MNTDQGSVLAKHNHQLAEHNHQLTEHNHQLTEHNHHRLSQVPVGTYLISHIDLEITSSLRVRLLELGFSVGLPLFVDRTGARITLRFRQSQLVIRQREAMNIWVTKSAPTPSEDVL